MHEREKANQEQSVELSFEPLIGYESIERWARVKNKANISLFGGKGLHDYLLRQEKAKSKKDHKAVILNRFDGSSWKN